LRDTEKKYVMAATRSTPARTKSHRRGTRPTQLRPEGSDLPPRSKEEAEEASLRIEDDAPGAAVSSESDVDFVVTRRVLGDRCTPAGEPSPSFPTP